MEALWQEAEAADRDPAVVLSSTSSQKCCDLQQAIWGFADIELLPLRFLVVVSKVGGHVFGAYDGADDGRLLLRHPRRQAGRAAVPAQPHAGRAAGVSQRRHRPPPQAAAARRRPRARHRADRVDLRSAGAEERLLQYRAAGRDRPPLHARISTASPPARCTAACPPTAASPSGGSIRRVSSACWHGEPHAPRARSERIAYPADIAAIRAEDPRPRARDPAGQRATSSMDAFARGLAVTGFERTETEGTYLLEP